MGLLENSRWDHIKQKIKQEYFGILVPNWYALLKLFFNFNAFV